MSEGRSETLGHPAILCGECADFMARISLRNPVTHTRERGCGQVCCVFAQYRSLEFFFTKVISRHGVVLEGVLDGQSYVSYVSFVLDWAKGASNVLATDLVTDIALKTLVRFVVGFRGIRGTFRRPRANDLDVRERFIAFRNSGMTRECAETVKSDVEEVLRGPVDPGFLSADGFR